MSPVSESVRIDQVLRGLDHLGLIDAARLPSNEMENASTDQKRSRLTLNEQNALVVHPVIADTNRVYLLKPNSVPDPLLVRDIAISLLASVLEMYPMTSRETGQPSACSRLTCRHY